MREFITRVNSLGKPVGRLPDKLLYVHFEKGARVLGQELRNARKSKDLTRCTDLSMRIASMSASTGYTYAWEAFADTEANPNPSVVGGLLGNVEIENPWKRIKAATPIGLIDLETFLVGFIEMRNECAHSGSMTTPPTPSDLKEYGANLSGLAGAIVAVLEDKLHEFARL